MKLPSFPKIYNTYFLAIISTLGGMLFGFDISSIAAIVGTEQYIWYFNNPSGVTQGGIGSSLAAGSVVGALFAGTISNRIGRRDSIAFACLWWLAGTAIQVSTHSVGQLIAGRFVNGICVGITSSQVPVYLAEIAKKDKRGSIIVIQQVMRRLVRVLDRMLTQFQARYRVWYTHNVLCRLRLLLHRNPSQHSFFPDRMGSSVGSCNFPADWRTVSPAIT